MLDWMLDQAWPSPQAVWSGGLERGWYSVGTKLTVFLAKMLRIKGVIMVAKVGYLRRHIRNSLILFTVRKTYFSVFKLPECLFFA